eukprot:TRINITY_DN21981_c0_g1_i2.p1 TRINITY_DN21981_c0_g1~~TRINITY_DN21981_c0_g1_i2.p1  ORF type:complete len:212 (+),score=49.34 TRINITY_DN21981_c0_g1_i2:246-881(+)
MSLPDELYKVVLIGNSAVGKSSLCQRYTDGAFEEHMLSTIGVDFGVKMVQLGDRAIKLQVWDTAGQERFRSMKGSYYRRCDGVIIVFDLTSAESFRGVVKWIGEIKEHCTEQVDLILVGNKADLCGGPEEKREISSAEGHGCANEFNMSRFFETSAKDGSNVDCVFQAMAESIYSRVGIRNRIGEELSRSIHISHTLADSTKQSTQRKCRC